MRRLLIASATAIVLVAACSDEKPDSLTAPPVAPVATNPAHSLSGQTADSLAIENLIYQLYSGLNGGDGLYNSAQTRFQQTAALYTNCNLTPPASPCDSDAAQANAYKQISDILLRYQAGGLNPLPSYSSPSGTGTGAAVTDLINLLLRYVGLDGNVCSFGTGVDCNATVYQPGSPAQILAAPSGQAGINLPPGTGTVTRPTVISVSRIVDPSVVLTTELDQYPYRYLFTSSSGEGALPDEPFLQDVTVEVCLEPGQAYPPGALNRLVLAHDVAEPPPYENIQILPVGTEFLTGCGTFSSAEPAARSLAGRAWQSVRGTLAAIFAPTPLAAVVGIGTGTVGTTKNLSPFGAVDPVGYITPNSPTSGSAPDGGTTTPPSVRVVTPSQFEAADPDGPGMDAIPVTFTITAGEGCFADPCVSGSPTTLVVNTDLNGYATVPAWTVGFGTNTVTATAALPCTADVPAGTAANCGMIVNPAGGNQVLFSVTGLPATQLNFNATTLTLLAGFGNSPTPYAPGTPFNVTVLVQDAESPPQTVPASSAPVTLLLTNGGTLVCPQGCTVNAVNGVATFTGVYITSTGNYQLTATSPGLTSAPPSPTGGFNVVAPPGSAAAITINGGNNQTAPEGSTLGTTAGTVAPSVKVSDAYGNAVGGVGVAFNVASGAGSVGSPTATTDANGLANTTWTIVAGTNTLVANIPALGAAPFVSFTATGTSVSKVLVDCPVVPGTGDELTRAFYITRLGKTIKEVSLYLASNDPANVPTPFTIQLLVSAESYGATPFATSTQTVYLRGSSSQNFPTNFTFPNVAIPSGTKNVAFQFRVLSNPNNARLTFGHGSTSCTNIVETAGTLPLPLSTPLRKGVGVKILGS